MSIKYIDQIESKPASDLLVEDLAKTFLDCLAHDHPERGEDLYCLNLVAYMGERIGPILARLREAEAAIQRVRDMHPKRENPTHGCCAPPKVCKGHAPECRSFEHGLWTHGWPCDTIRALDGQ
jgi:hypothetical protein